MSGFTDAGSGDHPVKPIHYGYAVDSPDPGLMRIRPYIGSLADKKRTDTRPG